MAKKKIDFSFFALNFSRKNEMKKLRKPKIFVFHGFMETKSVSHQIGMPFCLPFRKDISILLCYGFVGGIHKSNSKIRRIGSVIVVGFEDSAFMAKKNFNFFL